MGHNLGLFPTQILLLLVLIPQKYHKNYTTILIIELKKNSFKPVQHFNPNSLRDIIVIFDKNNLKFQDYSTKVKVMTRALRAVIEDLKTMD